MKKLIKKIFNQIGIDIKKIDKDNINIDFEDLLKKKIKKNPLIFDVGANRGQSIETYKKIFENPIIHSFEPIKSEFKIMAERYKNEENVFLNNCALGSQIEQKELNITVNTKNSSFNRTIDSDWLKKRSKEFNVKPADYITSKQKVNVITLDHYCEKNKIDNIDLLKIDTQGYEDKVLQGSLNNLRNNNIKAIITEITFSDIYEKYFSFSDLEKFLIPNNFRMVGINLTNNNLFTGLLFGADVYYFSKKYYKI